jgi:hypothetical protein
MKFEVAHRCVLMNWTVGCFKLRKWHVEHRTFETSGCSGRSGLGILEAVHLKNRLQMDNGETLLFRMFTNLKLACQTDSGVLAANGTKASFNNGWNVQLCSRWSCLRYWQKLRQLLNLQVQNSNGRLPREDRCMGELPHLWKDIYNTRIRWYELNKWRNQNFPVYMEVGITAIKLADIDHASCILLLQLRLEDHLLADHLTG